MRAIKSRDTSIEIQVRRILWHAGYRYRLNVKALPGKPDIYLPKYRAVIQINGCLWHGHNCPQFVLPKTRTEFWRNKIKDNVRRDLKSVAALHDKGLRLLVIWECALQGKARLDNRYTYNLLNRWLSSTELLANIDKQGLSSTTLYEFKSQINPSLTES
ncbi:very short patch repair endonuclease [Idiomarina loihiensis]|nr:very short patch repair endonuclease [Idiomarina loihiensis]